MAIKKISDDSLFTIITLAFIIGFLLLIWQGAVLVNNITGLFLGTG